MSLNIREKVSSIRKKRISRQIEQEEQERIDAIFRQIQQEEQDLRKTTLAEVLGSLNPAFYLHLFSSIMQWDDVGLDEKMTDLEDDEDEDENDVFIWLGSLIFLLRRYEGLQEITISDRRIFPGDFFWEAHVMKEQLDKKNPFTRLMKIHHNLNQFIQLLTDPELHTSQDKEIEHVLKIAMNSVIVGDVSHLCKIFERIAPDFVWKVDFLPKDLLELYRLKIQIASQWAGGTDAVKIEDLRSIVFIPLSLEEQKKTEVN